MSDEFRPIDFLNPLTPLRLGGAGARAVQEKGAEIAAAGAEGFRQGVDQEVENIRTGLLPFLPRIPGLPGLPSLPDLTGGLKEAGDDINKLANKALLGELVLVGGIVAIAGIAAWYLSRSPEAREATKTTVIKGGKA